MPLRIFSRRRDPDRIATYADFLDFLESRSAFLAQKCVFEYCRARTGLNWDKLMLEQEFLAAYETSRWEAFGAALADLAVFLEGRLRPADTRLHARLVDRLLVAVAVVLARHPLPAHRPEGWGEEIAQLRERLNNTQLGQPLAAAEVAKTAGARIYAGLPLHKDMTRHDRELVTNAVRFNFSRIASDLEQQLEVEPLLRELLADEPPQGR